MHDAQPIYNIQKILYVTETQEMNIPRNPVQFQKGMCDADFEHIYGTEIQCRKALFM